jgi:HlyD family secretion protein
MNKTVITILLVFGAALVGWTFYFLYAKSQEKPVVYKTASPFTTDVIKKTVASGSIVPRKEIEIKPQVSGIVEKIYVEPGDKVKNGDIIAHVKIIPNMVNLNNAESRVNLAEISVTNSQTVFDRQKQLYQKELITLAEYQQYEIQSKNAKEELEAAQKNLQLVKEGALQQGGAVSNTIIRSTIDGMVLDVPIKEGNSVIESNTFNDGTTIAKIADMGEMIFEGKVDESEVGKLKENMDLLITIGAIEGETFQAKLEYIAPKGVEENGAIQFQIKAVVVLKDNQFIRAGYSANADIVLERKHKVMVVEESLLQFSNDSIFVEIETKPQQFEKRKVSTGLSDGINIEILSGISMNDKIKVAESYGIISEKD